jgi:NADH:ubiquinone oxidoreductase subunit E
MDIYICVGSSCHLKGSYDVIREFQSCIKQYGLEDSVTLKASFCMGHCTGGVAVKIGEEFVDGVSADNVAEVFKRYILEAKKN